MFYSGLLELVEWVCARSYLDSKDQFSEHVT
jgi:hypothetical protein